MLMKFVIKRNGKMQNVGARPRIYELANKNGVQVIPRNTADGNIEVIAKGSEEEIDLFWKCIKKADLRPLAKEEGEENPKPKKDDGYEVGKPEPYSPDKELDFTYFAGSTTMEQVSKGTHYLGNIDSILGSMDSRLGSMDSSLSSIDSRLETLPEEIAKAIQKKEKI